MDTLEKNLSEMLSYSSSDGEYEDARDGGSETGSREGEKSRHVGEGGSTGSRRVSHIHSHHSGHHLNRLDSGGSLRSGGSIGDEPDWGDQKEDFDGIYNNTNENDVGDINKQHGSVLMHLLSQVSIVYHILNTKRKNKVIGNFIDHWQKFCTSRSALEWT